MCSGLKEMQGGGVMWRASVAWHRILWRGGDRRDRSGYGSRRRWQDGRILRREYGKKGRPGWCFGWGGGEEDCVESEWRQGEGEGRMAGVH